MADHKYVSVPNAVWTKVTDDLMLYQDSGIIVSVLVVEGDTVELLSLHPGAKWLVSVSKD